MLELRTQAFVHPSLARLFSLSTPFAALCGHMFAAHAQSDTTKLISSYCRVLRLLAKGQLSPYRPGGDEIYSFFREAANWAQLLPPRRTFQISARVTSCTDIPSSHLVQIRGRDAICDSIRDARSALGCQPSSCYHFRDLPCWSTLQLQSPCNLKNSHASKSSSCMVRTVQHLLQMLQAKHVYFVVCPSLRTLDRNTMH